MALVQWKDFLLRWGQEILKAPGYRECVPIDAMDEKLGWVGFPGANENQIAEVETRLGITLPNSYREFLMVTNGWPIVSPYVDRILPIQEIDWFAQKSAWQIDAYKTGLTIGLQQFQGGESENVSWVFNDELKHLEKALQISEGGIGVYLLFPQARFEDGECEAWIFEPESGTERYRSFWELMLAEYESFKRLRNDSTNG